MCIASECERRKIKKKNQNRLFLNCSTRKREERERSSEREKKFSIMHKFYDVITLLPEFAALRNILLFV
jgi:hypothetical protein